MLYLPTRLTPTPRARARVRQVTPTNRLMCPRDSNPGPLDLKSSILLLSHRLPRNVDGLVMISGVDPGGALGLAPTPGMEGPAPKAQVPSSQGQKEGTLHTGIIWPHGWPKVIFQSWNIIMILLTAIEKCCGYSKPLRLFHSYVWFICDNRSKLKKSGILSGGPLSTKKP